MSVTTVGCCSLLLQQAKNYDHLYSQSGSSTPISCKARKLRRCCMYSSMRMRKTALFLLPVWNSDVTVVFRDPNVPCYSGMPVIPKQLTRKLAYLCLYGFSGPLTQNGGFWGKIGEGKGWGRVVRCWPTVNLFLLWGCYLCATFGENRSRNATVRVRTDRQTDRQRDRHTQWQRLTEFITCPMLYAMAIGQTIIGWPFEAHGVLWWCRSKSCLSLCSVLKLRLHDTTGCETGLTTGCIVYTNIQPVVQPGLTTSWTNSGCLFNTVVKPVVSCKRGITDRRTICSRCLRRRTALVGQRWVQ